MSINKPPAIDKILSIDTLANIERAYMLHPLHFFYLCYDIRDPGMGFIFSEELLERATSGGFAFYAATALLTHRNDERATKAVELCRGCQ